MIAGGTGNTDFESLGRRRVFSKRTANNARRRARKRTVDRVSRSVPAREDHSARAAAEVEIQAWGRGRSVVSRPRPRFATTVPARIGQHRRARNGNRIEHADGRWPGNPRLRVHRHAEPPGPGRCSPRRRALRADAPLSFGTTTHRPSDQSRSLERSDFDSRDFESAARAPLDDVKSVAAEPSGRENRKVV